MSEKTKESLPAQHFVFLDWLRVMAMGLVVWYHLVLTLPRVLSVNFPPGQYYLRYIENPLHLDSGQFGVLLFFLVSGFIITHVAMSESIPTFILKRALRIYPPVIFAVLLYAGLLILMKHLTPGIVYNSEDVTPWLILQTIFIVTHIVVAGFQPLLPVMWTLTLEVLFYAVTATLMPILKRKPVIAVLIQFAALLAIAKTEPHYDNFYQEFAIYSLLTPLFVGQIIYLGWSKRISVPMFLFLLLLAWGAGAYAMLADPDNATYLATNPVAAWRLMAYLTFGLMLLLNDKLPRPRPIRFFADISYSLYLLHLPAGYVVAEALAPHTGYPIALCIGLILTILVSALSYRFIEQPARNLIRRKREQPGKSPLRQEDRPAVS